MTINKSITQQVNAGKALRSGGEVASSGSTEAIGDAKAYLRSSGLHLLAKGAEHCQEPRGGSGGGLLGGEGGEAPSYLDLYANVVTKGKNRHKCPKFYKTVECKNGHRFAKKLVCGREWCPICGAEWSDSHKRRFSRWLGKVEQMKEMGYLVFTLPIEVRGGYRTKEALNELTKRVTCGDKSKRILGLLKEMGFDRGLCRWHWFGDKGDKWHPHLNVIIEAGRLSPLVLAKLKSKYAKLLGVPLAVVNYSYTRKQRKMVHILKYVTRATFLEEDWDYEMASELWNFRNMRAWGDWSGEPVWELKGEAKYAHIEMLEKGICPECGESLHWSKGVIPICLLELEHPVDLGAGYYRIADIRSP